MGMNTPQPHAYSHFHRIWDLMGTIGGPPKSNEGQSQNCRVTKGSANSTQWALPALWDLVLNLAQVKRAATVAVGLAIDLSALILKKRAQFGTI
eukprot:9172241-Pyramimonas_sp.AAC.1